MANSQFVAILKGGVEEWNHWYPGYESRVGMALDLTGADLSGINLAQANLRGVDLSNANLGPRLESMDEDDLLFTKTISFTDLSGADLSYARLASADLTGARLAGANFGGAELHYANFNGAYIAETDFTGAHMIGTVLSDLDLRGARGLEGVRHLGPSSIGIDTLYRSQGAISRRFLLGAGVPSELLEYLDALIKKPIEFFSCFISYSHADKMFARRIYECLQDRGIRCWLDEKQLLPGDDIYEHIDHGIRVFDKILLCCSEHSLKSWWVDNELGKAFAKEQQLMKGRGRKVLTVIPINLDGFLFQWKDGKADEIRRRYAADFTGWEREFQKFEREMENVIRALRSDRGVRENPPKPKL